MNLKNGTASSVSFDITPTPRSGHLQVPSAEEGEKNKR
jgi:hypothetical protein